LYGLQLAAERGATPYGGNFHARHARIDAELRGADDLVRRIDAPQRLADQAESGGILERDFGRNR
jgi:hypothetical protein